jgi:PhzF family phenazine biosynthesis protein
MTRPIQVVDAFTEAAFAGNPAAVCLLDAPAEPAWMQSVAAEMNLSETAFLVPGEDAFGLRWFTPRQEVDLCGHATLASAHVLWQTGALAASETAHFDTASGRLSAARDGDWITLDFPVEPVTEAKAPVAIADGLDSLPRWSGRNRMDWLIALDGEGVLRGLAPDFARLAQVDCRGIIVTAPGGSDGIDFVSRFFAPRAGIDEDPVTGSAHCALAPFWAARLGRDDMMAAQLSARGGLLRVGVRGDRVAIAGRAVTVWKGKLLA